MICYRKEEVINDTLLCLAEHLITLLVPLRLGNGIVSALAPESTGCVCGGTCAGEKYSPCGLWFVGPSAQPQQICLGLRALEPVAQGSEGQGSKQGKWWCIPTRKEVLINTSMPVVAVLAKRNVKPFF